MSSEPLFRVLVGSAAEPRPLDQTLDRISRIKGAVLSVLASLNIEDRLEFYDQYCAYEQKHWLQVHAKESRQLGIFDAHLQGSSKQAWLLPPTSDEALSAVMEQAFALLQRLRLEINWTPSQFFEILKVPEYRELMQFVSFDESAEFDRRGHARIQVPDMAIPKRTLLEGQYNITFRVHMLGVMEASIEMPRGLRRVLRTRGKKVFLCWERQQSSSCYQQLEPLVRSGDSCSAIVRSIVARSGHCVALELLSIGG